MRILLVDNDRLLLESLCVALQARNPGLEVEMADAEEPALALAQAAPFDLILLDWWLGNEPARHCLERLRECCAQARIVVMSGDDSPQLVYEVLELRAAGFLRKNAGGFAAMREALDVVAKGGVYLPGVVPEPSAVSPSVRQRWVGRDLGEAFPQLTPRQLAVLRVLLRGASDKVIARELDIALTTVKTHVAEVLHRLDVAGRAEAVALAARKGVRID
jgi:DNA-binding NarL/FixJ family response regulator